MVDGESYDRDYGGPAPRHIITSYGFWIFLLSDMIIPARSSRAMIVGYIAGFGVAGLLTAVSFYRVGSNLIWQPCIPDPLVVLAFAQLGVRLVLFWHITPARTTLTTF